MGQSFEVKDKRYKYKAFISYSHKDIKFAKSLHKSIENYKIPNKLREKYHSLPKNLKGSVCFLDEKLKNLNALSREVKAALKFSENLVIVSSSSFNTSKYAAEELDYFKQEHDENKIFTIMNDKNSKLSLIKIIALLLNVNLEDLVRSSTSTKPALKSKKRKLVLLLALVTLLVTAYVYMKGDSSVPNKELVIIKSEIVSLEQQLSMKEHTKDEVESLSMSLTTLQELKNAKEEIVNLFEMSEIPFIEDAKKVYNEDGVDKTLLFLDSNDEQLEKSTKVMKNLIKAKLYMEKGNLEKADLFYEKSVKIAKSYENMYEYALFLTKQNKLTQAEIMFEDLLEIELSKENRANVLNKLGELYVKSGMYKEAKKVYEEAVEIREELANKDVKRYNLDLAVSYNNLALLYKDLGDLKESENTQIKALKIRKELLVNGAETHTFDLSTSSHNLANLHSSNENFNDAEKLYEKSLKIRRDLAKKNSYKYTPSLAQTLDELAALYAKTNLEKKAEPIFKEALKIRRELYLSNPLEYSMLYYDTLTNLYSLYKDTKQDEKAEALYEENI